MKIAVLGATGLVGRTMLRLLEAAYWLSAAPVALASPRSAGSVIPFRDGELVCREVGPESFAGVDVALFSAGGGPSRTWAPRAAAAACNTHLEMPRSASRRGRGPSAAISSSCALRWQQ